MDRLNDFKNMIQSEFFNIEMLLGYLTKYKEDQDKVQILVDRLRKYQT